jgi:polyisoprenoid-binding protein YceI
MRDKAMSTVQTHPTTTTWQIDPSHSQIEFSVRHLMISNVRGYFTGIAGAIQIDANDLASSSVEVEIDAASIDTRNSDRDTHLRSADFFAVEEHPTLRFRSTGIQKKGGELEVAGELTIRGVTRQVLLRTEELGEAADPWGNQRVAFRGETKVNRKDFGLTWNQALETGGVLVGDEVRIVVEVEAFRAQTE